MKLPGPDHPISITSAGKLVVVSFHGQEIARSNRALALDESKYPTVIYVPAEDAHLELMPRSDHTTYCPYKGEATYRSLSATPGDGLNAVWSYEKPYPAMEQIRGYLAFYTNQVDVALSEMSENISY
jgi:uncharacterized protein (DUF427 family)